MKKIMLGLVMVMMLTMVGCGNATNNDNPNVESEVSTEVDKVVVNGNTGEQEIVQTETPQNEEITIFAQITRMTEKEILNDKNEFVRFDDVVFFAYKNSSDEVVEFCQIGNYEGLAVGDVVKFVFVGQNGSTDYHEIISWEKVEN